MYETDSDYTEGVDRGGTLPHLPPYSVNFLPPQSPSSHFSCLPPLYGVIKRIYYYFREITFSFGSNLTSSYPIHRIIFSGTLLLLFLCISNIFFSSLLSSLVFVQPLTFPFSGISILSSAFNLTIYIYIYMVTKESNTGLSETRASDLYYLYSIRHPHLVQ